MTIYTEITAFGKQVKDQGRLLGLDIGMQKIGLAMSDPLQMIATPYDIIKRQNMSKDTGKIRTLCRNHQLVGLVVGWPLDGQQQEGDSCQMVQQFLHQLRKKTTILPIFLQDESFSTRDALDVLRQANLSRKKQQSCDDHIAASLILRYALDRLHAGSQSKSPLK